jgi:hypothetical protein
VQVPLEQGDQDGRDRDGPDGPVGAVLEPAQFVRSAVAGPSVERRCGCLRGRRISGIVCADDVGCLSPGLVSSLAAAPCRWGHV